MIPPSLLDVTPKQSLSSYLRCCMQFRGIDAQEIHDTAQTTIRYLSADAKGRQRYRLNQQLEQRWYAALATGAPDYSVYDANLYLAELWACWIVYSRRYLLSIRSGMTKAGIPLMHDMGWVRKIADLGCGIGYTTGSFRALFPHADITGTNFEGSIQTQIARSLGTLYGFTVVPEPQQIAAPVDLVFASEYFEHIYEPIDHLCMIIECLAPRVMFVANAFGTRAIGHFDRYLVAGKLHDGKEMNRLFAGEMKRAGYQKIETTLWNNRPAYWKRG